MRHAARPTRCSILLRGLLVAVLAALGAPLAIVSGQPREPQTPPLTQRAEIAPDGVTVSYPAGWSIAQEARAARIVNLPPDRFATADFQTHSNATVVMITVEQMPSHADALRKLRDTRSESTASTTFLTIGGWPALQRRAVVAREQPGNAEGEQAEDQQQVGGQPVAAPQRQLLYPPTVIRITTAIAAGELFVRAQGQLLPDTSAAEEALVRAISRSLAFRTVGDPARTSRELTELRAARPRKPLTPPRSKVRTIASANVAEALRMARLSGAGGAGGRSNAPVLSAAGLPLGVTGGSEAEIAVSTNGQNIVIAQAFNYSSSTDGGLIFTNGAGFPGSIGDGSVAYGRSGTFYAATIGAGTVRTYALPPTAGATFAFRANAFTCPPATGTFPCGYAVGPTPIPDQEHIAADRFNASAGGGDRVYVVWRHNTLQYGIACSNDGGNTWGPRLIRAVGDLPRVTVGQDGRVYVVYQATDDVRLDRFAACPATAVAMTVEESSRLVATLGPNNWVSCTNGVPGLDRCNNGNNLSSFMVAVDDTDATHIFVAYAQNTAPTASPTNESIVVQDSINSGTDWLPARTVTVSSAATARRFMPWVCAMGGVAYVNWFDRRAATATNNSLTDFYAGSATRDGAGNLVAGVERRVNALNSADNQCEAGQTPGSFNSWPSSTRAPTDSDNCTPQQPQLAGRCFRPGTSPQIGTNTPCDFDAPACPTVPFVETCQPGSGVPKYGDYNGNACAAGRIYSIWPSATAPPSLPAPGQITLYFAALVVAGAQIQIPGPVALPDTCVGTSSLAVANVCNTGKTDLHIDPITSSDSQFAVVAPSSGYPVTIGPSSCFPFEVRFTPSSAGPKSATLTVPSDDTVTPSVTIPVSGRATQTGLTTLVADTGQFGTVCAGGFHDLPLVLTNPGSCPLTVSSITSNALDFVTPQVLSYPLVIAPGAAIDVPIRFQPTSPGTKTGTITVNSTDPTTPAKQVRVSGTGGQPAVATMMVDTGNFGKVCSNETRDEMLTIANSGTCPLVISGITSSSLEFQMPQVLSYPVTVAPGASLEVPIRFAPTTPGVKSATITISSNDPVALTKTVAVTGETPDEALCHPPTFASVGMSVGPTFGSSKTGDYTFTGQGRYLVPFGERHTLGFQAQGEYLFYDGRQEGEVDFGLMNRWKLLQGGVFGNLKFAEFGVPRDGGVLGQASFTLDLLFNIGRIGIFGSKGFKDAAVLTETTSFLVPPAGATATSTGTQQVARVVDTLGAGGQVRVLLHTDVEGHLMWLKRGPSPLSDGVGAMARVTHHVTNDFALFGEVTLNETLLGPTDSGRVVFGFTFGRWPWSRDLTNKHTPLGADVPRVHYDLTTRQR